MTLEVLNNGTDLIFLQFWNILVILVTAAVLNNGTVTREAHPLNILSVLLKLIVLLILTFFNFKKFLKLKEVTVPITPTLTFSTHAKLVTLVVAWPNINDVILGELTAISNQLELYVCKFVRVCFCWKSTVVKFDPA